jgi:hypothetical protein
VVSKETDTVWDPNTILGPQPPQGGPQLVTRGGSALWWQLLGSSTRVLHGTGALGRYCGCRCFLSLFLAHSCLRKVGRTDRVILITVEISMHQK